MYLKSIEEVQKAQEDLSQTLLPWTKDLSSPPKFHLTNGLGVRVALVDPWMGGYNPSPHKPEMVGWKVKIGNRSWSGVSLSIESAKIQVEARIAQWSCQDKNPSIRFLPETDQDLKTLGSGCPSQDILTPYGGL